MNTNRILAAAFAGIATLALAATAAAAGGGHGRYNGKGHGYRHDVVKERVVYAPGPAFTIPHRIAYRDARYYAPYTHRRYWDPYRRDYVVTYQFPVVVRGAVVYRPFSYCDGVLVSAYPGFVAAPYGYGAPYDDVYYRYDDRVNGYVSFRGPNVSIGIGF
jgi:hypothetical protein